jgi:hypothetical protein
MKKIISQVYSSLILTSFIGLAVFYPDLVYAETEDYNRSDLELDETEPILPENVNQNQLEELQLNISPEIIEESPVLQRWLEEIPDVLEEIRHDPSFATRIRFGYSYFSSTDQRSGFHGGLEDLFLGKTGLTISGEYQQTFDGDYRQTWGEIYVIIYFL